MVAGHRYHPTVQLIRNPTTYLPSDGGVHSVLPHSHRSAVEDHFLPAEVQFRQKREKDQPCRLREGHLFGLHSRGRRTLQIATTCFSMNFCEILSLKARTTNLGPHFKVASTKKSFKAVSESNTCERSVANVSCKELLQQGGSAAYGSKK